MTRWPRRVAPPEPEEDLGPKYGMPTVGYFDDFDEFAARLAAWLAGHPAAGSVDPAE